MADGVDLQTTDGQEKALDKVWNTLSPEYLQGWRDAYEGKGKQSDDLDYLAGYRDQQK